MLMELQQELVKNANNKEAYDEITDQIFALREKHQQASMDTVKRDEQLQASQNCRISSKTSLLTLQCLMKHL